MLKTDAFFDNVLLVLLDIWFIGLRCNYGNMVIYLYIFSLFEKLIRFWLVMGIRSLVAEGGLKNLANFPFNVDSRSCTRKIRTIFPIQSRFLKLKL